MYTSITALPDELLLHILRYLDLPELLVTSRLSRHLRELALDPLLHRLRLKNSSARVDYLLQTRPSLISLQPPSSAIYLTRTHVAARRLHWSLVCIRLNRSLARRPEASTLISANILPKECCKVDRRSGNIVWGAGVAGALVERKRKLERESLKEGLSVWLERKAKEISFRRKDDDVRILVWRFSKRIKVAGSGQTTHVVQEVELPKKDKVNGLKRFWESLSSYNHTR